MWGTDVITTVTLEEGQTAAFIAYDHCSRECVGIHTSRGQIGGRLWSQSGIVSKTFLEQPRKILPKASVCRMITALNTWNMTFKKKSNG